MCNSFAEPSLPLQEMRPLRASTSATARSQETQDRVTFTFSGGCTRGMPGTRRLLKRTQEIQDILLLALRESVKKFSYNSIRFGPRTPGLLNGALQISGSSVVKKKDALSEPPQGRGSKF